MRLIDASALFERIRREPLSGPMDDNDKNRILDIINSAPTVDAVPSEWTNERGYALCSPSGLLPCPFCGQEMKENDLHFPLISEGSYGAINGYNVVCPRCRCRTGTFSESSEKAIMAWNHRVEKKE